MRLKSELWVKAYLRRCRLDGADALLVRRGDTDAGARRSRRPNTC